MSFFDQPLHDPAAKFAIAELRLRLDAYDKFMLKLPGMLDSLDVIGIQARGLAVLHDGADEGRAETLAVIQGCLEALVDELQAIPVKR